MLIPGFLVVLVFSYFPLYGLQIAFRRYDIVSGLSGGKWVGMRYVLQFFNDVYFFRLIRNTFLLGFYGIIFGTPAALLLALMLNEVTHTAYKRFVQSVSYLPYFISTVVVVGMLMKIFSSVGVVNQLLASLGLEEQLFFSDPRWFRSLYVGSGVWQSAGYSSILYLAALASNVDPELVDAATVDGAHRGQRILHIYIPCLVPIISVLLILNIGNVMRVGFDKVYLMYNMSTYETADIISTYVYRRGLNDMDFSYATAVGLFNSFLSMILILGANIFSRKLSGEALW